MIIIMEPGATKEQINKVVRESRQLMQKLGREPTDEEIELYTNDVINAYIEQNDSDFQISMKDMKSILSMVQEKYPMANGKIVSKVLKEKING